MPSLKSGWTRENPWILSFQHNKRSISLNQPAMDILTHAAIGIIAAGAFIENPPLSLGLLAGSVAPDLDVLSRLFGKRAMLRCHQTASHSIFVLALVAALLAITPLGIAASVGFLAGGLLHVLMDYTNTLGVTLLWPVNRQRMQVGWVFFIDAWVMAVTLSGALLTVFPIIVSSRDIALVVVIMLGAYWFWKRWLLTKAKSLANAGAVSIIPSAFLPWQFYVCSKLEDQVSVTLLNVFSGAETSVSATTIFDAEENVILTSLPEWRLMRELSPAYHAVSRTPSATGRIISCRDLRIRNFKSTYGDLDVHVDATGAVIKTVFHV